MELPELGVVPGFACGFNCAHCAVSGEAARGRRLTDAETELLLETVRRHSPRTLSFTGGEPTLYVDKINRIISAHPDRGSLKVRLTTNGHFAKDRGSAVRTLRSFVRLDEVQLSYDRFHAESLSLAQAGLLCRACAELSIGFSVVVAVSSPLDLAVPQDLRRFGDISISYQKVLPLGRAKANGLAYQYPAFDPEVLSKSCPNKGQVFYICGRGFSSCCSSMVFGGDFPGVLHPTLEEHLGSQFHSLVGSLSFSELLDRFAIGPASLAPEHSSPCTLCAHIFSSTRSPAHVQLA
jgi:hypothetical protein